MRPSCTASYPSCWSGPLGVLEESEITGDVLVGLLHAPLRPPVCCATATQSAAQFSQPHLDLRVDRPLQLVASCIRLLRASARSVHLAGAREEGVEGGLFEHDEELGRRGGT